MTRKEVEEKARRISINTFSDGTVHRGMDAAKPKKSEAELLQEMRDYRANLDRWGLGEGERWWRVLLGIVDRQLAEIGRLRFCAKSREWFVFRARTRGWFRSEP